MNKLILLEELREIFNAVDPAGLYSSDEDNIDEYDSEIQALIAANPALENQADIESKLSIIFAEYFGDIKIDPKRIQELSEKIIAKYKTT